MKNLIVLVTLLLVLSCQKKEKINQDEAFPMNQIAFGKEYDSLYFAASRKGDCDAFFELYKDIMEEQDKSKILKLAKETININPTCGIAQSAYFNELCRKNNIRDYYEYAGRDITKMTKEDYKEALKTLNIMLKTGEIEKSEFNEIIK